MAVKEDPDFAGISSNPPAELQALKSALRSRALEFDCQDIKAAISNPSGDAFQYEPLDEDFDEADAFAAAAADAAAEATYEEAHD